jgi:ribonuclease D
MASVSVTRPEPQLDEISVFDSDLDQEAFDRALRAGIVAWDIETTGLDWRQDRIGTVQLQIAERSCVVRINGAVPHRLKALLEDTSVLKVMHHAMFDLRFLVHRWQATPSHVVCTKIAAKLVHPDANADEYSLAALVRRYFGVTLDKGQRLSDWTTGTLDASQLRYAADDVRYLWALYERLDDETRRKGLLSLRNRCYAHLNTRVELDLRGYPDVFAY